MLQDRGFYEEYVVSADQRLPVAFLARFVIDGEVFVEKGVREGKSVGGVMRVVRFRSFGVRIDGGR
jgi:hypothetical protein